MHRLGILRRLIALGHRIIAGDVADPQAVIGEMHIAARILCRAVIGKVTPMLQSAFIFKKGDRKQLSRLGQAFETFNGMKPRDLIQRRAQGRRPFQIGIFLTLFRLNLENNRNHHSLPLGIFVGCRGQGRMRILPLISEEPA